MYGKNIITKGKCTGHEKVINVCIREDCESEQENIDDFYEKIKQNYNIRKVSTVIKSPVVLRKRIGELAKVVGNFCKCGNYYNRPFTCNAVFCIKWDSMHCFK